MNVHTFAARAAAALVAAVAGAASFEHIASVAIGAGERPWVGYALPLAIDGLIVVGVAAMLEDRQRGVRSRWRARLAVITGVVATLAANVASADPTTTARLVAVAAPVSFLLSVEVLTRPGRKAATEPADEGANRTATPPDLEESPPGKSDSGNAADLRQPRRPARQRATGKRSAADKVAAARQRYPEAAQAEIGKRTRLSARTVARYWRDTGGDLGMPETAPNGAVPADADGRAHEGVPAMAEAGGPTGV